MHGQPHIS